MGDFSAGIGTFVGRVPELRALEDCLAATRRGEGRLVLVEGEAGIGKTAFCREVATLARDRRLAVAWGSCWSAGGAPPLWPWQSILAELGDRTVRGLLAGDPGGATMDQERFARFAAVTDRLIAACAHRPALVVIDDVHAADAGAVLLARFVARALDRLPVTLVLTRRGGLPATSGFGGWDIDSEALVVTLGSFGLADTAAFLRSHGETAADEGLHRALLGLTGGHPLRLRRVLTVEGTAGRPAPEGVRVATVAAADRLSGPARHLLGVAALLGPSADVAEAAAVAEVPLSGVHATLGEALPAGLLAVDDPERLTFSHELVRQVLADRLSADERTATHARAAEVLAHSGPRTPERLLRRAYHALRAAPHSTVTARAAVAACRAAAHAMVDRTEYERAGHLLAEAVTAHERAGLTDPLAPVLVERAEAVLRGGWLARARELFDRAADAATAERDPVTLARAALGLGGMWVNEHRTRLEWERVAGLQRRALAGLPPGEVALRHRLVVRLAAEDAYRGGPVAPVRAALDEARRLGDGRVLAEALSLCHHALLTPGHTRVRLDLADELIAVASRAGEDVLALLGLCWRTVDLFHLGHARATGALAELRERLDAVGCQSVRYIAEAIEVMLLIRAGRLADAETRAKDCLDLGMAVGDADALGFFGAHLTTIRWLQGRHVEMLETIEQIADSPTLNPAEFGFQATVASLAAHAGRHDQARTALDRLAAAGLAGLPESSTWLAGMLAIVEAARVLGDARLAAQAYDLLAPYAELPVMPSLAVTCLGSVHRALGLAALTCGDVPRAAEHLEEAVRATRLLGNRPVTAVTMAELAEALLRRQRPDDRRRAADLLDQARAEADAMGMPARGAAWQRRLAEIATRDATITHQGRHWTLTVGERRTVVPDRLGVRYLARLLTNPGRPIAALDLAGGPAGPALVAPGGQPVLDRHARAAYRRRITELTNQLAGTGDRGGAAVDRRLRTELDALLGELRQVTGRAGRTRHFPDPAERARTAVRKAIKRAVDAVAAADPGLGAVLAATVSTGASCCYSPDPGAPLHWTYTDERRP